MNYYFSEEHEMFRSGLKDFLAKNVVPNIDEWEEKRRIPKSLWKKFGDMGYFGLNMPEEYGGLEADFFYSVVFVEEISKCYSGGFSILPMVQLYMSLPYIIKHGSETLKAKYLPKAIAGEAIASIAITEPSAGSDVANIKTRAEKDGDFYIVNGSKTFITNAVYGDIIITVVKTDPKAGINGVSLLVIDRNAEGVSARKLNKMGWHCSDTAELNFDNVRVPAENLVGQEGQGFYYLMGGLQTERLVGAVSGIGGCEAALGYGLKYMSEREAFGRPINRFQVLRHRVAQMSAEIEATKYFIYHCCRLHQDGQYAVKESSMAKLLASELANKVTTECLQFFGGYGYMEEYKIARMFRDARIGTIGGGTSEIMREIIAKMVIDEKSYQSAETIEKVVEAENKLLTALEEKVSCIAPIGASLQFATEAGDIFLDGNGATNKLSETKISETDCKVEVQTADLQAMLSGNLNPMTAFMSGKIKVKGNMGVAMKLQQLFG